MELGCPSLRYVYDMTWAEFQIRLHAYIRMQQREDLRAREIAWAALISFHADPKKLPKSKDRFWSIGNNKKKGVSEKMIEAIKKAQSNYKDALKK